MARAGNNIIQLNGRCHWEARQCYLYAGGTTLIDVVLRKAMTP